MSGTPNGSAAAGSPQDPAVNTGNQGAPAGQSDKGGAFDYESGYKELEHRFGAQGQELGEYRTFFTNIQPILEKLDQSPELVQAIVDGKVTGDLAKAVMEGRVNVSDAAAVAQADAEVKKEVGVKALAGMSTDEINKLVEAKAAEIRREMEERMDLKAFEDKTAEFIKNTPDFADHAQDVDKWLDKHPEVTDVEVAYFAVKGQMSAAEAAKKAEIEAVERAKEMALNAGGGRNTAQYGPDGTPLVDTLIGGSYDPNRPGGF